MKALAWLTWRQHRWTIIGTTIITLVTAYSLIRTETEWNRFEAGTLPILGFYALLVQLIFGGLIGMFWGAPLLARELEERTYFVAWGQDVTPAKWLRGKVILLAAGAVVLGFVVGLGDGYVGSQPETWSKFEADPLVQVGYALMGFAAGVLAGLLTRHVFSAMAATLVAYVLLRLLLAFFARDHYLPAARQIVEWEKSVSLPPGAVQVGEGFIGADMRPLSPPSRCLDLPSPHGCMRLNGATATYVDYQPVDRVGVFQVIEFVVCTLIAAGLLAVTFLLLRRGGGWRPTRSHRRDVAPGAKSDQKTSQQAEVPSAPATVAAKAEG